MRARHLELEIQQLPSLLASLLGVGVFCRPRDLLLLVVPIRRRPAPHLLLPRLWSRYGMTPSPLHHPLPSLHLLHHRLRDRRCPRAPSLNPHYPPEP